MKGMEIFCASQASTAVSLPIDQPSSPSPAGGGGGRAIDRHNPIIISDARRSTGRTFPNPPCSSQYSPINPQPYRQLHKPKKTTPIPITGDQINTENSATQNSSKKKKKKNVIGTDIVRWSCTKPSDLATPPGSTRYLLSDKSFRDGSSNRLSTSILHDVESNKNITPSIENQDESKSTKEILSSSSLSSSSLSSSSLSLSSQFKTTSPSNQVVVLRVSLHCRGCEGKVRKHLSKMEGVTSFNIDFGAKKVTIMGNITPEGVLESVSKVKNAQFWTTLDPTPPSSSNSHSKP